MTRESATERQRFETPQLAIAHQPNRHPKHPPEIPGAMSSRTGRGVTFCRCPSRLNDDPGLKTAGNLANVCLSVSQKTTGAIDWPVDANSAFGAGDVIDRGLGGPSLLAFLWSWLRNHLAAISFVAGGALGAGVLLFGAIISASDIQQAEDPEKIACDWVRTITALHIHPVYPPSEDFHVGDIIAVRELDDPTKNPCDKGGPILSISQCPPRSCAGCLNGTPTTLWEALPASTDARQI